LKRFDLFFWFKSAYVQSQAVYIRANQIDYSTIQILMDALSTWNNIYRSLAQLCKVSSRDVEIRRDGDQETGG
jgi:hypothetical protein